MLEAAQYARLNRGPDPLMARAGPMTVHVRLPPGVARLPEIDTTVLEEVALSRSFPKNKLLKTVRRVVTSK